MLSHQQFENAVFRYRSIEALLGERAELERQTVYFSPPEYLNDPMEGLRKIYWRGDEITWRNLLQHYVMCLQNRFLETLLTEDSEPLNPLTISVFQTLDKAPTPQARLLCKACIAAVEAGELHAALLNLLVSADRDVSFSELQQHLRTVHTDWLQIVQDVFVEHHLIPAGEHKRIDSTGLISALRSLQKVMPEVRDQVSDVGVEIIHDIQQSMVEQIALLAALRHEETLQPKRESLFFKFTSEYLNSLLKLVYPPWYVACFSGRHDNTAMWSYYAGNHQGCCLVFRKQLTDSGYKIRLKGPNGYGNRGIFRGEQSLSLAPVQYTAEEHPVEFFTSIGRLPLDSTLQNWFRDDDGTISPLAEHLNKENMDAWRGAYWKKFAPPLLRKLPDWGHEEESRVVLSDGLGLYDTHEGHTFTYDYDTLDGIIFGVNTNLSDKTRVLRIINKKLAMRTSASPFKLYQARYSAKSGTIEADHLSMITHVDNPK